MCVLFNRAIYFFIAPLCHTSSGVIIARRGLLVSASETVWWRPQTHHAVLILFRHRDTRELEESGCLFATAPLIKNLCNRRSQIEIKVWRMGVSLVARHWRPQGLSQCQHVRCITQIYSNLQYSQIDYKKNGMKLGYLQSSWPYHYVIFKCVDDNKINSEC